MAIYTERPLAKPQPRKAEGSSRSARTRAVIFMLFALAAGLTSAVMVMRYVARHSSQGPAVAVTKIVVASVDIPIATKLAPDMLKLVDWPADSLPQGSFEAPNGLDERVSSAALVAGEPIVEGRLSPKGTGPGMSSLIPANSRAMTVPVNDVVGLSGFIHPGDHVDVITTMQEPVPAGATAVTQQYRSKIVLQDIRVLATGQQLTSDGNNKPVQVQTVTLLVTPEEAERLALASGQGKLQLTMRSPLDQEQHDTTGVSPLDLLGSAQPASAPAPVAAAAAVGAAPVHHHAHAAPPPAASAPASAPSSSVDVVEVLHGDKVEQRKVNKVSP